MMRTLRLGSERGLTLIEVLIAVAMLAMISILIYSATTRSFDINKKLSSEANDTMNVAIAMQTFEKDISQMYSPLVTLPKSPALNTSQPSIFWSAPLRADGLRRSRLIGSPDKISFVNLGNLRVVEDSPESDFQKVSWKIEKSNNNTFTLFRVTDSDVFTYNDNLGFRTENAKVAILENISSAKFLYYRKDRDVWEDNWDSENQYAKPEQRYPDLISIKMEIPDPINPAKSIAWETIARPLLTLNEPANSNPAATNPSGGGS